MRKSRAERVPLIDWEPPFNFEPPLLPISTQAELLTLNRTSLYYNPVEPSEEELRLRRRIDEIDTDRPVSGSRYMTAILRREGWIINRKRVSRCMREMGMAGVCPGPNLSKRNQQHIFTERFWRTIKYREVYTKEYASPRDARINIGQLIHKYHHERPHQSLWDHKPAEIYLKGMKPSDPIPAKPNVVIEQVTA